uniref:Conserved plasma membrane protein n=1 Tax=Ascaris lumbricoides TaxID=6252 RepID=A0A0M3IPN9_ASCLU
IDGFKTPNSGRQQISEAGFPVKTNFRDQISDTDNVYLYNTLGKCSLYVYNRDPFIDYYQTSAALTTLLHANLRILLYSQSIALVMMAIARAITDLNALVYIIALSIWLVCIALIVGSVSVELSNPDLWWVIEGRGRILTCAQTFLGPIVLLYYLLAIITINIISLTVCTVTQMRDNRQLSQDPLKDVENEVFLLVFRYNYKKYGSSLTAMTSQHSLSERYQTIEIVKVKFCLPVYLLLLHLILNGWACIITRLILPRIP